MSPRPRITRTSNSKTVATYAANMPTMIERGSCTGSCRGFGGARSVREATSSAVVTADHLSGPIPLARLSGVCARSGLPVVASGIAAARTAVGRVACCVACDGACIVDVAAFSARSGACTITDAAGAARPPMVARNTETAGTSVVAAMPVQSTTYRTEARWRASGRSITHTIAAMTALCHTLLSSALRTIVGASCIVTPPCACDAGRWRSGYARVRRRPDRWCQSCSAPDRRANRKSVGRPHR